MTRRIAVVTAGLSQPSTTRLLADQLADAAVAALGAAGEDVAVDVVELRDVAHALTDHLLTGFATGGLAEAIGDVARADGLIVVTPVFSASYSGLFKTFFDVLEPETLAGKPVLLAATAGTARHSLVLEHALRPCSPTCGRSPSRPGCSRRPRTSAATRSSRRGCTAPRASSRRSSPAHRRRRPAAPPRCPRPTRSSATSCPSRRCCAARVSELCGRFPG
ncbi:CE1759 family FMN reductase [Nocardioides zeae]